MERQQVIIPGSKVELSNSSYYEIQLKHDDVDYIKHEHDIVELVVIDPCVHIQNIHLIIGGMKVASYHPEDFSNKQNIFSLGLPTSKLTYQNVHLRFEYDGKYIEENEEFIMEDEYRKERCLSDTEEEFFDGNGYVFGYRVKYYDYIPTGNKIRKVLQPAIVDIPEVHIVTAPKKTPIEQPINIPIWETLVIDKTTVDEEYFKRLIWKHGLHVTTEEDINELYNKNVPFTAKIRNWIGISGGIGSKVYMF